MTPANEFLLRPCSGALDRFLPPDPIQTRIQWTEWIHSFLAWTDPAPEPILLVPFGSTAGSGTIQQQ